MGGPVGAETAGSAAVARAAIIRLSRPEVGQTRQAAKRSQLTSGGPRPAASCTSESLRPSQLHRGKEQAAGLVDTLKGAGPFTVFAPTDEAFAKLPAGTLDALLKDIPKLKGILTYHVVAGKVMAADVVKLKSAKTVNGQSVKITAKGGKVMVDKANVVKTDIECSNGVIHVIDAVLLPKK